MHQYGFTYDPNDRLTQAKYRGIGNLTSQSNKSLTNVSVDDAIPDEYCSMWTTNHLIALVAIPQPILPLIMQGAIMGPDLLFQSEGIRESEILTISSITNNNNYGTIRGFVYGSSGYYNLK